MTLTTHTKASRLRYVAPERLNNEGFVEMISRTKIRMIAIDEAHCISEWGHAFRPDYLKGIGHRFSVSSPVHILTDPSRAICKRNQRRTSTLPHSDRHT